MEINEQSMKTRQEIVTDTIRHAILRGRYRPGDWLDQATLAAELNVSRSPVREALRVLSAEDLLTHYSHRGTMVTRRSLDELAEILFIRQLLEGAAIRRATPHITEATFSDVEDFIAEASECDNAERVLTLNNAFHAALYNSYPQPLLLQEIQAMRNRVAPYNRLYLDGTGQKEAAWTDHQRIYDACRRGDPDTAEAETHAHLVRVFNSIMTYVKQEEASLQDT
jgi:DNA-binding GntR family transcriptional regulator